MRSFSSRWRTGLLAEVVHSLIGAEQIRIVDLHALLRKWAKRYETPIPVSLTVPQEGMCSRWFDLHLCHPW